MLRMSIYAQINLRESGSLFGYSYAFNETQKHFRKYLYNDEKIQIDLASPKCKIQLYYGSPEGTFYDHQYKIQMTQWESTMCPPQWKKFKYDEWWTANQFGAEAMINGGITESKVHIYEHGVDSSIWTPHLRGKNKTIKFLHVDAGGPRKRSDLVLEAFLKAFEGKSEYYLTLKYSGIREHDLIYKNKKMCSSSWAKKHVVHITDIIPLEDLVKMYHDHDVVVYPSEGEGFGLIPLQALATGMPVISTSRWCSYDKYFKDNIIESKLGKSKVIENYKRFGNVVLADLDSIIYQMKKFAENIESQSLFFYEQVPLVVDEYSWTKHTKNALDSLIDRVGIDMFKSYTGYLSK